MDEKRVNGKVVQEYFGYPGKSPNSRNEAEPEGIIKYVERLPAKDLSHEYINVILNRIA